MAVAAGLGGFFALGFLAVAFLVAGFFAGGVFAAAAAFEAAAVLLRAGAFLAAGVLACGVFDALVFPFGFAADLGRLALLAALAAVRFSVRAAGRLRGGGGAALRSRGPEAV